MANILKSFLLKIFERPMPPLTTDDVRHAKDLRQAIEAHVQTLGDDATESERSWHRFNEDVRSCINERDPREFLQWHVIRRTMFLSNASYVASELRHLKRLPDWKNRWREAIDETPIGRPRPYLRHPRSSGNLIHHAYHVARFESELGMKVKDLGLVFEFGGGYGSMARLFHKLGFDGRYLIFDFPYFSALQRFFLRSIGMHADLEEDCVNTSEQASEHEDRICCLSDFDILNAVLPQSSGIRNQLFIATWSISETPLSIREKIMPLARDFDYFLIAFQHRFGEMDNIAYFRDWTESMGPQYQWRLLPIEHLPENSYLFGWKTTSAPIS